MRILIADDDEICRKVLEAHVKKYGDCDLAENGQVAVDLFQKSLNDKNPYGLVFLDIMMPEKTGHEVLVELLEIEEKSGVSLDDGVPVVMTTALDDQKNILEAFSEGAEYYLVKPVGREKLEDLLVEIGIEDT